MADRGQLVTGARQGQIVTFYSYKGGTGRTMALANVAWILASAGKRVLVADWDLEAPGLHRFFAPFLHVGPVSHMAGVIDMVREYESQVGGDLVPSDEQVRRLARVDAHTFSIDFAFPGDGQLAMLSAGRQNANYATSLGSLDWDVFYENLGGAAFLDAVRDDMRAGYDYTLIDSRTGFSDVADICTQHLPDVLVDCFTLSDQGVEGAARVAHAVATLAKRGGPERPIRILPVAMRVDAGERDKAATGRAYALRSFPDLPSGMTEPERVQYFASVEVPYQSFYAYEETLATFVDQPGVPTTLLAAYERLTGVITQGEVTSMPAMDEADRERWRRRFERSARPERAPTRIQYAAADQVWAEWAISVLAAVNIGVTDEGPVEAVDDRTVPETVLTIVSPSYLAARRTVEPSDPWMRSPHLLLLVSEVRLPERVSAVRTSIAHLGEEAAIRRLLTLVGHAPGTPARPDEPLARFPGTEPRWFRVPARNARFTGRTEDLQRLRQQLQSGGRAVVLPVALHGLGGVGKSQLALEYVHRFRSAYDLVWWIDADPPQFIDAALIDLGAQLALLAESTTVEGAQATLDALRKGTTTRRWLLVYDNAEDPASVQQLIPDSGPGHVLITSRNRDWENRAEAIPVDVFQREESVAHLRARAGVMTRQQAEQVAEALGDLPIAVSAAGAWLADTGVPVADYLTAIRSRAGEPSVQTTWDLSLARLEQQSPGGHRLLQICSVLAPEIAIDLLYSDKLMEPVARFDASARERDMRGALVQSINRLALLKLDALARQVQVHRLLQDVVRNKMTAEEQERTRHEVHLALAAFRPDSEPDDPTTWEKYRMIWRHLRISGADRCNDEPVRQLLIDRVRYLWRRGDLAQGRALGERVADQWAELLGRIEDPGDRPPVTDIRPEPLRRQLLQLRFTVANILREQANFQEALRLDEEVLAAQRELLGDRHANTLMTMGSYAADLRALGRYGEALPLDQETNKAWKDLFGDNHPRTLASANNLANALRAVGDFGAARALDEEVLGRRRVVLTPTHPYTLHSQAALGRDLREAGEYQESVRLLQAALELSREHVGDDALGTLNIQVSLAASLRSAGDPAAAAALLEDAYGALTNRFGGDNPSTLACRLTRAGTLLTQGDVATALEEMQVVTLAYQDKLGEDHPFTLVCVNNQSAAWRHAGDLSRAWKLATVAAEGCARLLGRTHPHYLAAAMNEAACRYDTGDIAGAAAAMAETAGSMESALGLAHPDALICRANLALVQSARPETHTDGAVARAVEDVAQRLSPQHPAVRELRSGRLLYRVTDPQDPF